MTKRVKAICEMVIENSRLFPMRLNEAARRLSAGLGGKKTSAITVADLDRYLLKAAGHAPNRFSWRLGGAAEVACYDLHMLGSLAGMHGDSILPERVKEWMVPHLIAIARFNEH